ncbi:hypothetical protein JKP31_21815 [Vibrio vulnificus]|nr:hypothetical protein [Vibrio vulnificus]
MTPIIQYIKASNPGSGDFFGAGVSLSEDGSTLAVGAPSESSNGTGVNSANQSDDSVSSSGAVYLY